MRENAPSLPAPCPRLSAVPASTSLLSWPGRDCPILPRFCAISAFFYSLVYISSILLGLAHLFCPVLGALFFNRFFFFLRFLALAPSRSFLAILRRSFPSLDGSRLGPPVTDAH